MPSCVDLFRFITMAKPDQRRSSELPCEGWLSIAAAAHGLRWRKGSVRLAVVGNVLALHSARICVAVDWLRGLCTQWASPIPEMESDGSLFPARPGWLQLPIGSRFARSTPVLASGTCALDRVTSVTGQ